MNFEEALKIFKFSNQKEMNIKEVEMILVGSLNNIGLDWENGNVSLAQVYMSGKLCESLISELFPEIEIETHKFPKVYTVVLDDYHVMGQKILNVLLKINGYEVIDLGYGISVDELVSNVKELKIKYLMISTLMLRAALKIKEFTQKINEQNIQLTCIVGGAPFNFDKNLWKEVNANAMGVSTSEGIQILTKMIREELNVQ
jgi:methanogenic corrinoid protein MtbC1